MNVIEQIKEVCASCYKKSDSNCVDRCNEKNTFPGYNNCMNRKQCMISMHVSNWDYDVILKTLEKVIK